MKNKSEFFNRFFLSRVDRVNPGFLLNHVRAIFILIFLKPSKSHVSQTPSNVYQTQNKTICLV